MTPPSTSPPVRFLHALANVVSTAGLYKAGHPAMERAFESLGRELEELRREGGACVFSFLDGEVIYGTEPLRELRKWPWSRRLAEVGVERLELRPGVRPEEMRAFASDLLRRLDVTHAPEAPAVRESHPNILCGGLAIRDGSGRGGNGAPREHEAPMVLAEEAEAVQWLHDKAADSDHVPLAEAAVVVRGILVALRGSRRLVAPLLRIKSTDQYTSAHCINVSILSMSLAEYLQFTDQEVRAIGEAALLHDIGKTRIPLDVLNKPGKLTPTEREIIERHPVEGARLLIGSRGGDVLTAVVAYEHHMHWAGDGGYPRRHFSRKPHRFTRLIQVCDVYDALRTRRPFRAPLRTEAALEFLRRRAGTEFDPDFASAFLRMMQQWEPATLPREEAEEAAAAPDAIDLDQLESLPAGRFDADTEQELYGP